MKAKRIISLFLLASLLISASACGSEAPEKESTDTTAGETTEKPEYERDRRIEEIFNVKLDVREAAIDDLAGLVRTSVMAGDQSYYAAYIKGDHLNGIITDGCVLDLTNVDGLNLDKPWWDQNVRNSCKLGKDGALYFAVSDLSLTAFDLTWCLMFNETKLEKLNLDKPYDLVRSGNIQIRPCSVCRL